MESDAFHLDKEVDSTGVLVLIVGGYLDEAGGIELSREADAALESGHQRLQIDLEDVVLFNCAGVRRLLLALEELRNRNGRVDLVHLRPPLQRLIEFAA
jgi:anti-anti-sigma factor